jgi:cobalt-zinc-cadmium efflux system outer membrane protein
MRGSIPAFALFLLSLACTLQPARTRADDSALLPTEVSWPDVVHLIRTRSPRLAAFRSQGKFADSEVAVAGVLPNPSLSYTGFGRVSRADNYGTQHQIGIEQPLLIAGQRGAHVRAAQSRARAVRAEIAVSEAELERDALQVWITLLAAQARFDELKRDQADVADVAHIVHERVAAGAEAQYDASRIDLESAQLDSRTVEASASVIEASASLAQTVGFPGWQPHALGSLGPMSTSANFEELWPHALRSLPVLVAAEREAAAARSEIEVARAERWGIPSISAGTFLTSDKTSASLFLGLSAPLPIFNFGGAALDRANAGVAAAQAERYAAQAEARAALAGAVRALSARRAALDAYDKGVGDRLPRLREMAEAAYRSGTANLLELLDSVRSAIEVRLARIELVAQVMQSEREVLVASGMLGQSAGPGPVPGLAVKPAN